MAVKRRFPPRVATVYCNGGCRAVKKLDYQAADCAQALSLCQDGPLACTWGCLGCGSCVSVCRFGALSINAHGVAETEEDKCVGCGACVRACPRQLIRLRLQFNSIVPLCSNRERGFDPATKTGARTVCQVSCVACGLCGKACPADAIRIEENHAVLDEDACLVCGMCAVVCPRHVIVDKRGVLTPAR
jgi:ferredoxin